MISTKRAGDFLAVAEVSHYLLPRIIHIEDLRRLVYYEQTPTGGVFKVEFATFSQTVPAPPVGEDSKVRDALARDLTKWLRDRGVIVEGGKYFRTDVLPFIP